MTSAMLLDSNVDHRLWDEAHKCATYIYNRIPPDNITLNGTMTPDQLFFNRITSLSHLKIFGSIGYVNIPQTLRKRTLVQRS